MNFEAMNMQQLVDFYNEKTGKNIKKFADYKTAVRRCEKLLEPKIVIITSKKFHANGLRGKCFELIVDGMTVSEYLEKAAAADISKAKAKAALDKMASKKQKTPVVRIER